MTTYVSTQVNPVGTKLVVSDDANATAQNAVTGAAGKIYMLEIDNSNNPAEAVYLKIYDNPAPVVGTTAPDFIFKMPANQNQPIACPGGLDFTTLSFAVTTSPGTSGSANPSNPVTVKMVTS